MLGHTDRHSTLYFTNRFFFRLFSLRLKQLFYLTHYVFYLGRRSQAVSVLRILSFLIYVDYVNMKCSIYLSFITHLIILEITSVKWLVYK